MGSLDPLRGYQGEDIEIQLPGNLTVYDIDWLAVWCVQYKHNFGHVFIPKDLDVPPALGQTKIQVFRYDFFRLFILELKHQQQYSLLTFQSFSSNCNRLATMVVQSRKYPITICNPFKSWLFSFCQILYTKIGFVSNFVPFNISFIILADNNNTKTTYK